MNSLNNGYKQSQSNEFKKNKGIFSSLDSRTKDVLIIAVLAIFLVVVVYRVFYGQTDIQNTATNVMSETEKRISALIEEMDGVGDADVMISEDEDGAIGAVVVCQGANDLNVILRLREAIATALNIQEKNVKIYLKKE